VFYSEGGHIPLHVYSKLKVRAMETVFVGVCEVLAVTVISTSTAAIIIVSSPAHVCPPLSFAQMHLKHSAIPLPLAPSNPAILPPWPQQSTSTFGSSILDMNAKGQVTIRGWLTPLVEPPRPSSIALEAKANEGGMVQGGQAAVLKRRRAYGNAAADDGDDDADDGDDESADDGSSSGSSSSSRRSSAPPSPKYDEGISFLPPPSPFAPTPSSLTSASAIDLQLQVLPQISHL
jgi:hypothetical protein